MIKHLFSKINKINKSISNLIKKIKGENTNTQSYKRSKSEVIKDTEHYVQLYENKHNYPVLLTSFSALDAISSNQ